MENQNNNSQRTIENLKNESVSGQDIKGGGGGPLGPEPADGGFMAPQPHIPGHVPPAPEFKLDMNPPAADDGGILPPPNGDVIDNGWVG